MRAKPKFSKDDMVSFKFSKVDRQLHTGVILSIWHRGRNRIIYEVASMNHSMCSYSICEECIVKRLV